MKSNMKKRILLSLLTLAIVLAPISHMTRADSGEWNPTVAEAAWDHDAFRVERLTFDKTTKPMSMGDATFLAEPSDCRGSDCKQYEVYQLENGQYRLMTDVPEQALNEKRFALNDGRFVYASPDSERDNRYDVIEHDLKQGSANTLIDAAFIPGAKDVDVRAGSDDYYFNATFDFNGEQKKFYQATVYQWNNASDKPEIIGERYTLRREKLQDTHAGNLLVNMEFESGHEQLWLIDSEEETMKPVPGTWTEPHGDIYSAHFQDDGTVEYFRYYTRYTYNPATQDEPTKHDQTISWFGDIEDSYAYANGRMAWVDTDNKLYVSGENGVMDVGKAHAGKFTLDGDKLFFATATGGQVYDLNEKSMQSLPIYVTDAHGDVMVGSDATGSVLYYNATTGHTMRLGHGSEPVVSDEKHVYWKGDDEAVYEATIIPSARSLQGDVRALSAEGSPDVYLVQKGERFHIPNERVFMSWFDSWEEVETVSADQLETIELGGEVGFAPGTKVKLADDKKVYLVGSDGKLHWIVSQTIAYRIYGTKWNDEIMEIPMSDYVDHARGEMILSERDIQEI
jgi:hypothetical protein